MAVVLSLYSLAALGVLLGLSFAGSAVFYVRWKRTESDLLDAEIEADTTTAPTDLERGELVDVPPPEYKKVSLFGEAGRRVSQYWHYKKRRKLLGDGYYQWYLLEDGWPTPKFVKPVSTGGGIPMVEHDGTKYLFPPSAAAPDEQTGLRTIVHKKGEADPVNLEVPNELAIRADVMSEYLTNELVSEAPKDRIWDIGIDLTPNQMLFGSIALVMILSFVYNWYTGGLG